MHIFRRSFFRSLLGLVAAPLAARGAKGRGQPVPLHTSICTDTVGKVPVSSITRVWAPGDTRRCSLCPECSATHEANFCAIMITNEDLVSAFEADPDATRLYRWPED